MSNPLTLAPLQLPPGHTLKEHLELIEMSISIFANKMSMSEIEAEKLFAGDLPITEEIASQIESALDIPKSFWLNLEKSYRKQNLN